MWFKFGVDMIQALWLLVALVKVAFHVLFNLGKKALATEHHPLHIAFAATVVGTLLYVPVVVATRPDILLGAITDPRLLALMGLSGMLNAAIFYTGLEALKREDVSIVSPLIQTYPIAVALIEPLILGDVVYSPYLIGAALLAALGGYLIVLDGSDFLAPFRRIANPGVQLALLTCAISALIVVIDRTALHYAGIPSYLYALPAFMFLLTGVTVLCLATGNGLPEREVYVDWRVFGTGVAIAGMTLFAYVTLLLTSATQASIAFLLVAPATVIVGGSVFEEDALGRKVVAALVIVSAVGVTLIS